MSLCYDTILDQAIQARKVLLWPWVPGDMVCHGKDCMATGRSRKPFLCGDSKFVMIVLPEILFYFLFLCFILLLTLKTCPFSMYWFHLSNSFIKCSAYTIHNDLFIWWDLLFTSLCMNFKLFHFFLCVLCNHLRMSCSYTIDIQEFLTMNEMWSLQLDNI